MTGIKDVEIINACGQPKSPWLAGYDDSQRRNFRCPYELGEARREWYAGFIASEVAERKQLPHCLETERKVLMAIVLHLPVEAQGVIAATDADDFYLGVDGFNGWLWTTLKEAIDCRLDPIAHVMQHQEQARMRGVESLSFTIGELMYFRDGSERDFSVWKTKSVIDNLKRLRKLRDKIIGHLQELNKAWEQWKQP